MSRSRREALWIAAFAVLVAFAVPWPLWGVDRVVAGLPVWIWWHVGWLVLCTAAFYRFTTTGAWERGMGIDPDADPATVARRDDESTDGPDGGPATDGGIDDASGDRAATGGDSR